MKKFLIQFTLWVLATLVAFEIVLRVFGLAAVTLPLENIDGDISRIPNTEGCWVRGGVKEINSHYRFNNKGWNSSIDYFFDDNLDSLKIALIGPSFIQGFHTSVENSIGRQFEALTNNAYTVYEFGMSGFNIVDYSILCKKYQLEKFHKVFLLIGDEVIIKEKAGKMSKGNTLKSGGLIESAYGYSHVLRYLNINHKMSLNFKKIQKKPFRNLKNKKKEIVRPANIKVLNSFSDNVVFLYDKSRLSKENLEILAHPAQEVIPIYLPSDCGFDNHWNYNGRKNCALAMKAYLDAH